MKYEYLDHTADVKFKAYGKTQAERFENAALAMFNTITDTKLVKPNIKKTFEIAEIRPRTLLYEFLEQFLVYIDEEGWLLSKIKVNIDGETLKCEAFGDTGDYEVLTHVKSITYSDMELNEEYVQVVLDI
jgi:SHS2 domain-containing protein